MSRPIIIDLPFPLSINALWRSRISGRKIFVSKSEEYKDWLKLAEPLADIAMKLDGRDPINSPVKMTLTIRQPDRRKRDIDNMAKCVLDVIEGRALTNDNLVHDLRIHWDRSEGPARCIVTISALGGAA